MTEDWNDLIESESGQKLAGQVWLVVLTEEVELELRTNLL